MRRHGRAARGAWLLGVALGSIVCLLVVGSANGFDFDSDLKRAGITVLRPVAPGRGATVITVGSAALGRAVPPGFVGLSLEYSTLEAYAGRGGGPVNPVLVGLIRGLAPGQRPVLRIGGDSTDWAWWPVPHLTRPLGVRITVGPRLASVLHALARAVDARLVLGIDLEADSRRIATVEATQLVRRVGARWVEALELGNEPELYGSWPWRITANGRRIIGRASDYGMAAYVRDFRSIASALPPIPLAGPAFGGPKWIGRMGEFLRAEPRVGLVTLHAYPLQACDTPLVKPTYPTIPHLLASRASDGLAGLLMPAVLLAHAQGLPLRVDEINNVACGGKPGVSNTFASALWALDTLFALARSGVDGVNFHTFQRADYALFTMRRRDGRWEGTVAPEYYGLLLFARAAPAGARLLSVRGAGGSLRVWATLARDGTIRIVLINDGSRGRVLVVHSPETAPLAGYEALRAPALAAAGKVTLGGASFGAFTGSGRLRPARRIVVRSSGAAYVLRLPAASAVLLTVPQRGEPTRSG
jgi:hypothetical protein